MQGGSCLLENKSRWIAKYLLLLTLPAFFFFCFFKAVPTSSLFTDKAAKLPATWAKKGCRTRLFANPAHRRKNQIHPFFKKSLNYFLHFFLSVLSVCSVVILPNSLLSLRSHARKKLPPRTPRAPRKKNFFNY